MIDRTGNHDESIERTAEMLVDAYCKLDDFTRRLMDSQRAMIHHLRRLHEMVMYAEDSKEVADLAAPPRVSADRVILDLLLQACHETFDALDNEWKESTN